LLLEHEFFPDTHTYKVRGNYVFSVSDILSLNGMRLMQGVPPEVLEWASQRGRMVHELVQAYEEDRELPEVTDEAYERFQFYLRWKGETGFTVCGPCERSIVYEHEGTGILVGGTPDLIGLIGSQLYVIDLKTSFRQSGKAKDMKILEWRAQTEGYRNGLEQDEEGWSKWGETSMHRMIVHLHPDCGIEVRGGPRKGYEEYPFHQDDSNLWHSMVTVAAAKLGAGHKVPGR
jgi:hypothetical protein